MIIKPDLRRNGIHQYGFSCAGTPSDVEREVLTRLASVDDGVENNSLLIREHSQRTQDGVDVLVTVIQMLSNSGSLKLGILQSKTLRHFKP